jgi:hypothetical protein
MGFGPTNVGLWRMNAALEVKDYERAATIAENLNSAEHPSRERRATYWMDYGRALAPDVFAELLESVSPLIRVINVVHHEQLSSRQRALPSALLHSCAA